MVEKKIPEYLREHVKEGLIRVNHHPVLPLVVCNYTPQVQYEKLWDDITLSHRGLVVDYDGRPVSFCLPKFFNYQELIHDTSLPSPPHPATPARICEKVDGSYIAVCQSDKYGLVVSSRGSFTSFHAGAARGIIEKWRMDPDFEGFYPNFTYIFELVHPQARIVVDYGQTTELVLLAAFEKEGMEMMVPDALIDPKFARVPKLYASQGTSNTSWIELLEPLLADPKENFEGYVIQYANYTDNGTYRAMKRVKVKLDEYVRLHSIITNLTPRKVFQAVQENSIHTVIEAIPDERYGWVRDLADLIEEKRSALMSEASTTAEQALHLSASRKGQAQYILSKDKQIAPLAFNLLDGKDMEESSWKVLKKTFDDWPETKEAAKESFSYVEENSE